ncbi:hypothetical protein ELQ35_18010 [Peribacillus cavernae]|uniref:Uncharacterized protein n=1 Tax=Peribacillus cavernae TaxID=1674310 RepID=A0A3S0TRZ6_9BACI|nr:hypothetical protein [Peribacillus cavernae]MDQ0219921.1 hypothetical protein [Peribacillus cavernae]RUQ26598.1 hypothetical protein ELQ35_18010 [Peribacillus cavernae]
MKEPEKQVNGETGDDGMMELFEIINAKGDVGEINEILSREKKGEDHSLTCNNELFNKELWAIVDDTEKED